MPDYLRRCFSEAGDIYPVYLNFEHLDRVAKNRGRTIDTTTNPDGDVELSALGDDNTRELAVWLADSIHFRPGGPQPGTIG